MAKVIKGRVLQKIDTTENWKRAINFVPLKGEICIYADADETPKIKIGDGTTNVNDLDFVAAEAITADEIDNICGASIQMASELEF